MWQNQLPPSMKPFKMGPVTFKTSDFGLGMAIQNKYLPAMAVVGEAGWGGAASTNWWARCVTTAFPFSIVCPCTRLGRWWW